MNHFHQNRCRGFFAFALALSMWGFTMRASAQTPTQLRLHTDVLLEECDKAGKTVNNTELAPAGAAFTIVRTVDDNHVIRFWQWSVDADDLASAKLQAVPANKTAAERHAEEQQDKRDRLNFKQAPAGGTAVQRFFLLPTGYVDMFATTVLSRWDPLVGACVLPFKLRPQDGDFTKDISLSGMGGFKYRPGRSDAFSIGGLIGVGLSNVTLDSLNTEGRITEASDRSAITISAGAVLQWERMQIGLFIGWDHLGKADRKRWINQGAHWFGIGIGVNIFSDESSSVKEGGN